MKGHHLVMGELVDFISGQRRDDTADERYRQKIARLLVQQRGYPKTDITAHHGLQVAAGENRAVVPVDFLVTCHGRIGMIVKYGPGSLTTRHRPVLAASRLVASYQVPVAVVTNGEAADVLEASSGRVIGEGLAAVPSQSALAGIVAAFAFVPIPAARAQMESRILYCYEVDGACPCDDTICRLP
jgi:hypothetical protein